MIKNTAEILSKLGISELNEMQQAAHQTISDHDATLLLSPTGSGKTVAFLLPILQQLNPNVEGIQALILVPSRELAIQIEQVARQMGTGYKLHAFYGGRAFNQDRLDLKTTPSLLIGTPGRIADHIRRHTFDTEEIRTLVLDEFDKSLEIGFEGDMKQIIRALPYLEKKVLTSATFDISLPQFVSLPDLQRLDFLDESESKLQIKIVESPTKDKLTTLVALIQGLGDQNGIIFCNFKDSIEYVSKYLKTQGIAHGCFHGGMEQPDRELALLKFRNGTHRIIVATDLAARGLDIPDLSYIIHYQIPPRAAEFTHRNGRTARMQQSGTAYVLHHVDSDQAEYLSSYDTVPAPTPIDTPTLTWTTLQLSVGRKDKISKGDIAGFMMKVGQLKKEEIGLIELKKDRSYIAVAKSKVHHILRTLDNQKVKGKKVRIRKV